MKIESNEIKKIAKKIQQKGGNLYLVGGAVRDKLLGQEEKDTDYCVTGITAEEFKELFPEANIRGKFFEVFDINKTEFAMARIEKKIETGHSGFEIQTGKEINIVQDLARRDITINSMAVNVLTKELIDPFTGQEDLNNKIIRATTKAFKEDPLRVYRVARFASTLGFKVESGTIQMMKGLKKELNTLSVERVFIEFKKALEGETPSIFFQILKKAEVLDVHFKEIYDLIGAIQPEKYHPEGDSYNHTMMVVDHSVKHTKKLETRFACLVHDLGKGAIPKEEYPHHYLHDKTGPTLVRNMCNRLKMPTSWKKCGITSAKEHMIAGIFYKLKPGKKVSFIERVSKTILGLEGMKIVVNCDKFVTAMEEEIEIDFEKIGQKMMHKINGKYIEEKYNIKPSKEFAKILHEERIKWLTNY